MNELNKEELLILIQRLLDWNALELCMIEKEKILLIPYVMNDAAECYLRFENCRVQGTFDAEDWEDNQIRMVENASLKGMIIRQKCGNTVTIWYQRVEKILNLYQYHQIGHSWRKEKGEEMIRRIVNLICVLHDKRNYLGTIHCNELECRLADLAEFPPVLSYTPINESILDWYEASEQGIESAMYFAELAGDTMLEAEFERYRTLYLKGKISKRQIGSLSDTLRESIHQSFWRVIEKSLEDASCHLKKRSYGVTANMQIAKQREQVMKKYKALGYQGTYPRLKYSDSAATEREILFVEEQPFSVMEEEDFLYRIFSMEFVPGAMDCVWKEECSWRHKSEEPDLQKMDAETVFLDYAAAYDRENGMIALKILHTQEVAKVMDRITQMLGLDAHQSYLAHICAVFHDIGRFEQVTRFGTFNDQMSVDHADLGCKVLVHEKILDKLPAEDQKKILIAIRNHNKYKIEEGLDPETVLLCQLLRDADKADIFRVFACEDMVNTMGETIEQVEAETITDEVYDCIFQHRCVDKTIRRTGLDKWIGFLCFFYDIYFDETIRVLMEKCYYRKPFDEADFKDQKTKMQVQAILAELERTIAERINT